MMALSEERGHIVAILDMNSMRNQFQFIEAFKKDIQEDDWNATDIIIVTCGATQYSSAKQILQMLRKYRGESLIVVCGGVPSAIGEKVFSLFGKSIDVAIIGEPEITYMEIVERVDSRRFSEVLGIAYRDISSNILTTSPRPLLTVEELNKQPFPDYKILEGVQLDNYFLASPIGITGRTMGLRRRLNISTQRGSLVNNGFFDGYSRWDMVQVWGLDKVKALDVQYGHQPECRFESPERIVNHIRLLRERYGVDFISFTDIDFMRNVKRLEEFLDVYTSADLHSYLRWGCYGDVTTVTPSLLRRMGEAGCEFTIYKLVSNSERILKHMVRTGATPTLNQAAVDANIKTCLAYAVGFEIGLDGEDVTDILDSLRFCSRNSFKFEPAVANLQLGSIDFFRHKECCFPKAYDSANDESDAYDQFLVDCGVKPLTVTGNHVFTDVEILGLREVARSGDLNRVLSFAHQTGREHGDNVRNTCVKCMAIDKVIEK